MVTDCTLFLSELYGRMKQETHLCMPLKPAIARENGDGLLFIDEATSSVDTVTEQKIRRAMLKICENRISFIIAHRLSTISDSDLIIMIENGEIAEQGTHTELMALNGCYAHMYRTQTGTDSIGDS